VALSLKSWKNGMVSGNGSVGGRVISNDNSLYILLWLPCIADADIIFLACGFFLLSLPNLSSCRLDVCHTSTHGVALVQI